MGVIGHHVHRPGPGKRHILLAIRLVIGGLHAARRIGISAGPRNFNQVRAQLSIGFLYARASRQLHHLRSCVIGGSLGGGGGRRRSLPARVRRALLDQSHVSQLHRRLQLRGRLRRRGIGLRFAPLRLGLCTGMRWGEGEQKVVAFAALRYPVGAYRDQAGVAGPAQAGKSLPVHQGCEELIALYGGVLGRGFGVDGVHVEPRAAGGENVVGLRAAVRAGFEVDVDLAWLASAGWSILANSAWSCRH